MDNSNNNDRQNEIEQLKGNNDISQVEKLEEQIQGNENINTNNNGTSQTTTNKTGKSTTNTSTTTTTDDTTCLTPEEQLAALATKVQTLNSVVSGLNNTRNSAVELSNNYEEIIYYNRMVKPLLDSLYFMSLAAQGTAITSQSLNIINLAKPKQVECGVELTYSIIKEITCVFEVLEHRMNCYLSMVENDNEDC